MLSLLRRITDIERDELRAVGWSFAYFFSVLCSYYIIRPLRDEMGVTVGADGLQWLFVIVFFVMLAAVPVFGWVVSAFPRRRVAPLVYLFCAANLIVFWLLFSAWPTNVRLASAFFVWVSVFNLFAVSLFWSVMSDVWTSVEAKRLYGFIAAGGSAGAFCGPLITQALVHHVGSVNLLLISALALGGALACIEGLRSEIGRVSPAQGEGGSDAVGQTGAASLFAGAVQVLTSPYLLKIALWILLANFISTFFYLEQARIVGQELASRADRVQLFARMDLAVSVLTVLAQLFLTKSVMQRIGVGPGAALLPLCSIVALCALALSPTLAVVVTAIVIERAVAFAISNPAMRVLYTVVSSEEKYKAQNFNDTVVFRAADAASGWVFNGLARILGVSVPVIAVLTVPFACAWAVMSLRLGREQESRAGSAPRDAPAESSGV